MARLDVGRWRPSRRVDGQGAPGGEGGGLWCLDVSTCRGRRAISRRANLGPHLSVLGDGGGGGWGVWI